MEFSQEYYFLNIQMIFHKKYKNCIPKNYYIHLYDDKFRIIDNFKFTSEDDSLEKIIDLKRNARYIKFTFTGTLGGEYIIIERMKFNICSLYNIK